MAARYTPEELKFLRESPLAVKPSNLPPAEQWMGAPTEQARNTNTRAKNNESNQILEPARRPGLDRHTSKTTNPEDIILGPPKTSFISTRSSSKPFDSPDRPPLRGTESKDRFSFPRGDGDGDRLRESRGNIRTSRRGDGDESEGWSTVKPRKSFGTEGAERFNGRMGLQKEDRRFRDKEERDNRPRTFESFSRDVKDAKDNDDHERERDARLSRNGIGRGRIEATTTWREREANKERDNDLPATPRDRNSNGDRFADRNRGWREKDKDDGERERRNQRNDYRDREPRRWGRDQLEEKDPEWNSQPSEGKSKAHTQEDFQKWKEQMHQEKGSGNRSTPAVDEGQAKPDAGASFFGLEKEKVETPLSLDTGPDKFFGNWGAKEECSADVAPEAKTEGPAKAKATGKASRFTSFFSPAEEPQRRLTEPPPPIPAPQPQNGLEALFGRTGVSNLESPNAGSNSDQEGIQRLLQKLKLQQPVLPRSNSASQPNLPGPEQQPNLSIDSPALYQQYRQDRPEEHRPSTRNQQLIQDMMVQRQLAGSQSSNPQEQVLQDLIAQRKNNSSQSSSRIDQTRDRNNADFLMGLMQSVRAAPEPQREHLAHRGAPRPNERQMQQQLLEREQLEMARERERAAQSQQRRPPPPGFYEDPNSFQRPHLPQDRQTSGPPPQPTQILQRPPPGLDLSWENRPQQMQQPPQPQHRMNVPPPPGLQGAPPNRGLPPNMYPPAFPVNNFPPEGMQGPPRGMMQPPPGFFGGPPPGFLPPGMNGFQGAPEGMSFGPFDGRGPPPQGFRR